MFGDDGDGSISAAHDGAFVVEGIGAAEVDHEAGVFGTAHEGYGGSDFNAEGFVLLGIWNARFCGGEGALAAPDIDRARRRSGATGVGGGTNTGGIGGGADVVFNFLFGVLADDEAGEEKRKNQETTENCKVAVHLHRAPREKDISDQRSVIGKTGCAIGSHKNERYIKELRKSAHLPSGTSRKRPLHRDDVKRTVASQETQKKRTS
jgi:hypothetical protein